MIGIVVVSHSGRLAEGVCELAGQVAQEKVRLAACGGTETGGIGTDAFRVLAAIESVFSEDGVLVLMDLGSAVLSAETAVELMDDAKRAYVRLCPAPLVEGAVAAAALAAAGASLEEIAREASGALTGKIAQLGMETAPAVVRGAATAVEVRVTLRNRLGLHARPAAHLVRLARPFDARVTLRNESTGRGPADAVSINGLLGLAARGGHTVLVHAEGPAAQQAATAVVAFINQGCGDEEDGGAPAAAGRESPPDGSLVGISAGGGFAVGPLVKLAAAWKRPSDRAFEDPVAEERKLHAAIEAAQAETRGILRWAEAHAGRTHAGIFDAQLAFLEDPELIAAAMQRIRAGHSAAEAAWYVAAEDAALRLEAVEDEYLRARAADIRDIAVRVMRHLTGVAPGLALGAPSVVAAHDLAPSEVKEFNPAMVLAVCLEMGSASAHSAILARAMGIPVVIGLGPGILAIEDGTIVAVDGEAGSVWLTPGEERVHEFERRQQTWRELRRAGEQQKRGPATTRDGHRVRVFANISGIEEGSAAVEQGAEGVGVLRTEFLFLDRPQPPSEDEQLQAYSRIAQSLQGGPLIVRTLDIGGDKSVPYVDIGEEANPFLGWRGLRLTLHRRDLLRVQLRAILRAAAGAAVDVLLPMVCSLDDFRAAQKAVHEAAAELQSEGLPYGASVAVGVMIETPAAVAIAPQLAREAAFFSIGTNDLVQYVLVADRTNPRVAPLADPYDPAVLEMLRQTIAAARAADISVTVCGELGGDPLAIPLLIGMGIDELSVSAPLIPELKRTIRQWELAEAQEIADRALSLQSANEVRQLLVEASRTGPASRIPVS